MHPLSVLLILLTAGHPAAAGTPAARFWEETLPGTPMPEAIANLVQQGIDHSPLVEHYSVPYKGMPSVFAKPYRPLDDIFIGYHHVPPASSSDKATIVPLQPGLFFLEAQVHKGSTMTTYFEPATVSPILPRDIAQKVPFSNLEDVLATFNIAPSTAEAAAVGDALSICQAPPPPLAGEKRACTTSLEGTVQSSMHMLGRTTQGVWAASSSLPRAGLPLQPSVVQAVTVLEGDRHVGCHSLPYPYAYRCPNGRPGTTRH
ncbi:unnamed protein product [Urochloa decumbens]|uniref:BURP domain-containing protein n=1 Tax=Urochloa decumbens TaxID=240449 RepID=A0ABC9GDC6_9POAL